MKASDNDALLVDCGKTQYRLEYWTDWQINHPSGADRRAWLENLGLYGKDYCFFFGIKCGLEKKNSLYFIC
jgi:hypothetical protein